MYMEICRLILSVLLVFDTFMIEINCQSDMYLKHRGQYITFCTYIAYAQMSPLNAHIDVSSRARSLNFDPGLHFHSYFVYASSETSGESAHMRRLVRVFNARQCDQYQICTCWFITFVLYKFQTVHETPGTCTLI